MSAQQFVVSAFSTDWRGGNPAAVCVLNDGLGDDVLQAIAAQNNLSETAFIQRAELDHASKHELCLSLRWFTPTAEVDLCGHATLATAHVLYHHLGVSGDAVLNFATRSGHLQACLQAHLDTAEIGLDFPGCESTRVALEPGAWSALGPIEPGEVWAGEDYLLVYENPETVQALTPAIDKLQRLERRGVIVTASTEGGEDDFVSRFFAPKVGVDEDPVTGSAHCQLLPFWSKRLGKTSLSGWQASTRGGRVRGEVVGDRVMLKGQAVTFSVGEVVAPLPGAAPQ
jgi:PhzF family phenazine biosynthesis protein